MRGNALVAKFCRGLAYQGGSWKPVATRIAGLAGRSGE